LLLGIGVLAFLSWLPQRIDALVVVSEAIADLIRGLGQLLEALLGLGAVILLALLLLVGLVALVGGTVRVCRSLVRSFSVSGSRRRGASVVPANVAATRRRSGRSS